MAPPRLRETVCIRKTLRYGAFWMTRAVCSKSPPGRLRNGPGTTWAPGGSFANQKHSVLERFGSSSRKLKISRRVTPKLSWHRISSRMLVIQIRTIGLQPHPELEDRDMGFHLLTTHETSLTPHRLMKARLHNENNRFGVVSAAPKTLHAN